MQALVFMRAQAILTACCLLSLAFNELPDGEQIPHVKELGSQDDDLISIDSSSSEALYPSRKLHLPVLISDAIPPIPLRLVKRVEQGLFIEMAELHPSYLDSVELNTGHQPTGSQKRVPEIFRHRGLDPVLRYIHGYNLSVKAKADSRPDRIPEHYNWGFTAWP